MPILLRPIGYAFLLYFMGLIVIAQAQAPKRQEIYLMTPQEVADGDMQILDTRRAEEFKQGHIAGSQSVDAALWMKTSMQNVRDQKFWETELLKLGLRRAKPVVIVSDSPPTAARVWWLLKFVGLPDVRIMDGGIEAYQAEKLPLTTELVSTQPAEFEVQFQEDRLAELPDVTKGLADAPCQIVDSRSEAEYTGRRGVGTRLGHIPGAAHLEWSELLDQDGKYLPPEELKKLFASKGIDLESPITAHCQTGGRSSVTAFALEMLGAKQVRNYYLGWSEYSQALTAPVEK